MIESKTTEQGSVTEFEEQTPQNHELPEYDNSSHNTMVSEQIPASATQHGHTTWHYYHALLMIGVFVVAGLVTFAMIIDWQDALTTETESQLGKSTVELLDEETAEPQYKVMSHISAIETCARQDGKSTEQCLQQHPLPVEQCNEVSEEYSSTKEMCLLYVAMYTQDVAVCEKIESRYRDSRDMCIRRLAQSTQNPKLCHLLSSGNNKGCTAITSSTTYEECRQVAVDLLNDTSEALALKIEPYKDMNPDQLTPGQQAEVRVLIDEFNAITNAVQEDMIACKNYYDVR